MSELPPQELSAAPPVLREMAVVLDSVTKVFAGRDAVTDLSFQIPYGNIIGLIGPSGCGKTTTVRLMTGIYNPTHGSVRVFGKDPRTFSSKEREQIGYMTQLFTLFQDLTIQENMNFAAAIYGRGIFNRGKPIRELLDFVNLTDDRHKLASKISGGMQRRLALAATLIHNPSLIFLDEPTAGIDPILRRKFWDQFAELRDQGHTLVITTQYVNEAAYCDYVGVMADGKLIMLDKPDALIRRAYGGDMLDMKPISPISAPLREELSGMACMVKPLQVRPDGEVWLVVDDAGTALPEVISWLNTHQIEINSIEPYNPPYDDVFVKIVEDYQDSLEHTGQVEIVREQA